MQLDTEQLDDILIGRLKGRLDAATSDNVQQTLLASVDDGTTKMALDLEGLEYISSAGLRVLLMAHKKLAQTKGKLVIFGLQDYIQEIFEIAGFTTILTLAADQAAAEGQLRG